MGMKLKRFKDLFFPKGRKDTASPESPDLSHIDPPLRLNLEDSGDEEIYPIDETLLPCAVCGRTFAPNSLAKHVRICMKTTPKKRKQFDSSDQRRKGTEIAQYLPKNFGSAEGSPFTEKERDRTPPASNRMATKAKPQNSQSAHSRLLATVESSPCPHCGRNFGPRAWERHTARCAEQARLKHAPGANSSGPENVRVARERLMARTSYRAPLNKSKRSMNREKYSLSRSASEGSGMSDQSFDDFRSSKGSYEDKHLPAINRASRTSLQSNMSATKKTSSKPVLDDSYDPYVAAERQLRDLMASASNLTKLDVSLDFQRESSPFPITPKSLQHSPKLKAKDDSLLKNKTKSPTFQRSKSLRSPSKTNPAPEIIRKHSTPMTKPSTYSLNSILNPIKANETNNPNKLLSRNSSISRARNDSNKIVKQSASQPHENRSRIPNRVEKQNSIKLQPVPRNRKKDDNHNEYSMNSSNMNNDFSGSQESFIDPRLINKDQPLPISVQKFLDNPDLLSSEESLLRDNLPVKFGSYNDYVHKERESYSRENSAMSFTPLSGNREPTTPIIDDLSAQYDKIMTSLEQSMTSHMSAQDEDTLYNDLEELMSSMDGESSPLHSVYSFNLQNPRNNISRDSLNGLSNKKNTSNAKNSDQKQKIVPYNKSLPMNTKKQMSNTAFNSFNRSQSLLDSNANNTIPSNRISQQRKNSESQLEDDIMQSLKDIDKFCDNAPEPDYANERLFSKQRTNEKYLNDMYRQETDLQYFLPKNLGLSHQSPFLEKEAPIPKARTIKPKEPEGHPLKKKLLSAAENIPCPNCGHCFDIRAWCAEQMRLARNSVESPEPEHIVQNSYRAPLIRSLNRSSRSPSADYLRSSLRDSASLSPTASRVLA